MSSGIVGMARYLTQPEEQEQRQLTFTSGLNRLAWNTASEKKKKKFASRRNPFIFRPTQASRSALEVQASRTLNKVQFAESSASTPSPPTTSPPQPSPALHSSRRLWKIVFIVSCGSLPLHVASTYREKEWMIGRKQNLTGLSFSLYISSIHHTAEERLYFFLSFFIKYILLQNKLHNFRIRSITSQRKFGISPKYLSKLWWNSSYIQF